MGSLYPQGAVMGIRMFLLLALAGYASGCERDYETDPPEADMRVKHPSDGAPPEATVDASVPVDVSIVDVGVVDVGVVDVGVADGAVAEVDSAVPQPCTLPEATIRIAEVVSPERQSIEEAQGLYPYVALYVEATPVALPAHCCPGAVGYDWEVGEGGYVWETFFNSNQPQDGGPRDSPDSPGAAIYISIPGRTYEIVALVIRSRCGDLEEERVRSAPLRFTLAER